MFLIPAKKKVEHSTRLPSPPKSNPKYLIQNLKSQPTASRLDWLIEEKGQGENLFCFYFPRRFFVSSSWKEMKEGQREWLSRATCATVLYSKRLWRDR